MNEINFIGFQVWNLKRALLTYHLSLQIPDYDPERWVQHYYINSRSTQSLERDLDNPIRRQLNLIAEGQKFKFLNDIFKPDEAPGNQDNLMMKKQLLAEILSITIQRQSEKCERIVELLLQKQTQEALEEAEDLQLSRNVRKSVAKLVEQKSSLISTSQKQANYDLKETIRKVSWFLTEEVHQLSKDNQTLIQPAVEDIYDLEARPILEEIIHELQNCDNEENQEKYRLELLLKLILKIHDTIHFSSKDLCEVYFNQQTHTFAKGYLRQLALEDLGIKQQVHKNYIFLRNSEPFVSLNNECLAQNCQLIQCRSFLLQFQEEKIAMNLPLDLPLKKCKSLIGEKLHIQNLIDIELKEKSLSLQEKSLKDFMNPINELDIFQIIEMELKIMATHRSILVNERGDLTVRQLKKKYEQTIGIQWQKQNWSYQGKEVDKQKLYKLKSEYFMKIQITTKATYELYGFASPQTITFEAFKSFSFENDQHFLKKIQEQEKIKFPDQQFEFIFRELCLAYFFSCIKKHSLLSNSIAHIQKMVSQRSKIKLWKPIQFKANTINKFNDTYLIYHLIASAQNKLKIQLLRQLKNNYPVPLLMQERGIPQWLYEEHYWIHGKAFNVVSLSFPAVPTQGKSSLLNYIFNTNFQRRQNLHNDCSGNVQICFNVLQSENQMINVIDISDKVEQQVHIQLIKACNMIMIHVQDQSAIKMKDIQAWLAQNQVYIPYIVLFRDASLEDYDNFSPITEPIVNEQLNTNYLHFSIVQLTPLSKENYQLVFQQICRIIHRFIKDQFEQAEENLWKLTNFLSQKSTPKLQQLNSILKEIDLGKKSFSTVINLQQQLYSEFSSNLTQYNEGVRSQVLQTGLTPLMKAVIGYCKENAEYLGETFKKLKDFLLVKKNELCKELYDIDNIRFMQQKDQSKIQRKLDIIEGKILSSKFVMISEKVQERFRNQLKILSQDSLNSEKMKSLKTYFFQQIYPKIFSIQLFWRELISMYKIEPSYSFEINGAIIKLEEELLLFGNKLIIESEAFELINGDLLDLPKDFLKKVFQGFEEKGVMVIGIVGPQSSGKSTLLNFVFGCDFMSSVGRCTKGVYGTYYQISNKEEINFTGILILDTEGLMSTYENPRHTNRNNFDLKILLFCIKICDIVIFNNRGDYTRQCKPLLELTFDPDLVSSEVLPDIYFVINMNVGQSMEKQRSEFQSFCQSIKTTSKIAKQCLKTENIISLPMAFNQQQVSTFSNEFIPTKKTPKTQYINETVKLNKIIYKMLVDRSSKDEYKMRNLGTFITQINQKWHTLNNYPLLAKFVDKQIKKIGCNIEEWQHSADEQLVQYLLVQKNDFEEKNVKWLQDQSQNINLQNEMQQKISKYQKKVQEKILQFDHEFFPESTSAQMKTDVRKFIMNKKQQIKQCFLMKKKIIEEYFKEFQLKTSIETGKRKKAAQMQKLIVFYLEEVKKSGINEERLKEYFHEYWMRQGKIKQGINIDRQVKANDIYERCSKIYKKFLNKQFDTKQKYQIKQYKLPCGLSLEEYQAQISNIFKGKFTSQDKIFEYNHKQPVFSVSQNQNGLISSKLQYFKMRDFYTTQQGYKFIQFNFKSLNQALKRQSLKIHVSNQISFDNRLHENLFKVIVEDLFNLGICISFGKIRQYIISQIIKFLWKSENQQEPEFFISQKNMTTRESSGKYSFFEREANSKWKFKVKLIPDLTEITLFQYNSQYLLTSSSQIQYYKKDVKKIPSKKEELETFEWKRNQFFGSMHLFTKQFCDENLQEIKRRRKKLNDVEEVKEIIKIFIKRYIEKMSYYNKQLLQDLEKLKKKLNADLIGKLNQNLSVINLRIQGQTGLFKEVFITKLHQNPIEFQSNDHLKKIITGFGQFWGPLKNSFTVVEKERQEQSHCKIKVNELIIKDTSMNDRSLEKYKSKEIEYFRYNSNKRNFLALAFQQILENKVFDKIKENIGQKIVEIAEETQLNIVEKIQGIIREVNVVLKDFNNDLRQICQKVIYDFEIQLHSWAFHYFWKLRQHNRWKQIQNLIETSKLQADQEQEYYQFQAKISNNPEIANERYAQECLDKYADYILKATRSSEKTLVNETLRDFNHKIKYITTVAKVDQAIMKELIKKIDLLQTLNQEQQKKLVLDAYQYLTAKIFTINRYYQQQVKHKIIKQYQADLKKIIGKAKQFIQEMKNCLQSTLQIDLKLKDVTTLHKMLLVGQNPNCQLKWHANKEFVKCNYKLIKFTDMGLFVAILTRKLNELLVNYEPIDIGASCRKLSKDCKLNICGERCPCCLNICIEENGFYRNHQHRCLGHQYRAVAGVSVEDNDSRRIPSYFRCDEVGNDDILECDGKTMSWENFKKENPEWIFQGSSPQNWDQNLRKLWSIAGKKICEKYKFDYISFQQGKKYSKMNMELEYILALDQSGSMDKSKWRKLLDAVGGQLEDIKRDFNQSLVSVLTFNQGVTPIAFSQRPSSIRIDDIKNKGGGTNYASIFRKIYELAKKIDRKSIVVLFITDGIAGFPKNEVQQLRLLKEQLKGERLEFIFITLFISDEENMMETDTLLQIKDCLGGKFVDVKDIRYLKSRLKEVQKSISEIFSNRASFEQR